MPCMRSSPTIAIRFRSTAENVLGVLSLVFWSLMIVVTLKYVTLILRADNRGEGGIMALDRTGPAPPGKAAARPSG